MCPGRWLGWEGQRQPEEGPYDPGPNCPTQPGLNGATRSTWNLPLAGWPHHLSGQLLSPPPMVCPPCSGQRAPMSTCVGFPSSAHSPPGLPRPLSKPKSPRGLALHICPSPPCSPCLPLLQLQGPPGASSYTLALPCPRAFAQAVPFAQSSYTRLRLTLWVSAQMSSPQTSPKQRTAILSPLFFPTALTLDV